MINHINQFLFLTRDIIYWNSKYFNNFFDYLAINMNFHLIFIHFRVILINSVNTTVNIAYFWLEFTHINYIYLLLLIFIKYTYSIVTYLSQLQICGVIITLLLNSITFCIISHYTWYYLHNSHHVNRKHGLKYTSLKESKYFVLLGKIHILTSNFD